VKIKMTFAEIGLKGKLFNIHEARVLLPLVRAVTISQRADLTPIQDKLTKMLANDPRRKVFENDYQIVVSQWRNKVELLGARVSGLWTVEFDVGGGSLCWRYPELGLNYFRADGANFSERVKLQDYIDETDPDWA
jgi:hypothetical protein